MAVFLPSLWPGYAALAIVAFIVLLASTRSYPNYSRTLVLLLGYAWIVGVLSGNLTSSTTNRTARYRCGEHTHVAFHVSGIPILLMATPLFQAIHNCGDRYILTDVLAPSGPPILGAFLTLFIYPDRTLQVGIAIISTLTLGLVGQQPSTEHDYDLGAVCSPGINFVSPISQCCDFKS